MKPKTLKFYNFNTEDSLHHSLYVFGKNVWAFYYKNQFGWIRCFNKGFKWKNINIHGMSFSERNSYTKALKIWRWHFYLL